MSILSALSRTRRNDTVVSVKEEETSSRMEVFGSSHEGSWRPCAILL
jgi:hypothetical protein